MLIFFWREIYSVFFKDIENGGGRYICYAFSELRINVEHSEAIKSVFYPLTPQGGLYSFVLSQTVAIDLHHQYSSHIPSKFQG
jgi:hypothetical protein